MIDTLSNGDTPTPERALKASLSNASSSEGTPDGTESSLNDSLLLLNRVVHAVVTSVVVTDPRQPDNPIVYHNPAFERITGYTAEEIDGRNCRFLQGPDTDPVAVAQLREAIVEERSAQITLLNYRKDGTTFWNELFVAPVYDDDEQVTHFVGVQYDATQRTEAARERDALLAQQQRIAETLQRALLLTPPASELYGLDVSTQYAPAPDEADFGGDFFDAFVLTDHRVALVVGDVAGKGLTAAQYTAEVKYALRLLLREYGSPTPALHRLNRFLLDAQRLDDRDQSALICVCVTVIDTLTGEASVASAGMEPPLLVRAGNVAEQVSVSGLILGVARDAEYRAVTLTLGEDDIFIVVTDGVTEARNPERSFFGYDGLVESAKNAVHDAFDSRVDSIDNVLETVGASIVTRVREFASSRQTDDICLLLARRTARTRSLSAQRTANAGTNRGSSQGMMAESAGIERWEGELARFALEVTGLGYWSIDTATRVIHGSSRCADILANVGADTEWTYERLLSLIHEEDRRRVDVLYEKALAGGTDWKFECRIHGVTTGVVRWIAVHGRHFRDHAGENAVFIAGTIADITEQKQRAQQQRQFLREILFGASEGHLHLCDSREDLPEPLAQHVLEIALSNATLHSFRAHLVSTAQSMGFSTDRLQDIATAAGECAMNAIVHAGGGGGAIFTDLDRGVLQVWVQDAGDGIAYDSLHRATLEKGFSSAGTLGHGFWTILRTADRVYLLTGPSGTTVVLEQERIAPEPAWLKQLGIW